MNPLKTILYPESIAIVGASNNPTKMGTIQFLNLIYNDYPGAIYPIHPTEKSVFGKKAYGKIKELPEIPDVGILVIPPHFIADIMHQFGEIGTKHLIIISAGFKETGEEGIQKEKEIIEIANRYKIRFLGPNCLGMINNSLPLNITAGPSMGKPGKLSLASQSGTYVAQTLDYMNKRGIRINKAISVGNEANIDLTDCLEFLGNDPETSAIGLYIECIRRPEQFLKIAREITRKKPIVVQYVGGTEAGARSGLSHTGAMAGPNYVYNGLFKQAGIIRVNTIEEVYLVGHTLSGQPEIQGNRIAILTNSGGPGTAMASFLDDNGLKIPEFTIETQNKLAEHVPAHGNIKNPVDLTFHIDMNLMTNILPEIILASNEVDGLIIHGILDTGWGNFILPVMNQFLGTNKDDIEKIFHAPMGKIIKMPWQYKKPILFSSFFGSEDNAAQKLFDNFIPQLDSPEKAALCMAKLYEYHLIKNRPYDLEITPIDINLDAKNIIKDNSDASLDEFQAKSILRLYGLPVCTEFKVSSLSDALDKAKGIGFPVVLKGCSPEVLHKTEAGIVHLNLQSLDDVSKAYQAIMKKFPDIPVIVSEMIKGKREIIAGMTRMNTFAPLILFGIGGIFAEIFEDRAIRFAPFGENEAISLIKSIKSNKILNAIRGLKQANLDQITKILTTLSQIAILHPEIQEIDINPIIIKDNGEPIIADTLFVKAD